jgi:hypothetical protein
MKANIDYDVISERVEMVLDENGENNLPSIGSHLLAQFRRAPLVSIDVVYAFAERYG